jgi:thiamine-phosphate pyrophosphorylase
MDEHYSHISEQPSAIKRILDANLDRAREGLRIMEEWCRFALNNRKLTAECKEMRQELARWHTPELRMARDTLGDTGTDLTHPQEETRHNLEHLLRANFCRVQEALRVLEEYGKLYQVSMGTAFKQIRYRVYILESNLWLYSRHHKFNNAPLYLVTSAQDNLLQVVEAALKGGLSLVQYRDKNTDDVLRLANAEKLCQLCHDYGALFIVNDRVDVALAVSADGVHLGQQDLPVAVAREILGVGRIIGRSTTNPQEMQKALAEGADYIGVGPVYETPTKAGKTAAGLEYVSYVAQNCSLPWFAIGGINLDNLEQVLRAGARRVSVVRAIMEADNPTSTTQQFLSRLS